mmetsp:Transcript_105655/g.305459  ORF Transcript_105655/g.305459 Transcript_105655/m.305459 type:complete len:403 (+) Transcript_105655:81-1289(+)
MVVPGGAGRCGGGGGGADSISKAAGDRGGRGGAASDGAPREAEADGDAAWLYHTCAAHATMLPARDIIQGALEALALAKTDEAGAQARLFDLLGDDGIETIMGVFARKDTLLTLTLADIMRFGPAANAHGQSHGHGRGHLLEDHRGLAPVPMAARRSGPSISQQITIRSQGEIDAAKRQRKDQRRAQRHAQSAGDGPGQGQDWLANLGFDEAYLEQERALGLQGGVNPDDPMGLNNLLPEGSREYHAPQALPSGTEREWREGYEWVHIPPPRRLPAPTGNELVPISSLPDWAQACFPGTKVHAIRDRRCLTCSPPLNLHCHHHACAAPEPDSIGPVLDGVRVGGKHVGLRSYGRGQDELRHADVVAPNRTARRRSRGAAALGAQGSVRGTDEGARPRGRDYL